MPSNTLFNIHIQNQQSDFECSSIDTILDSALRHGLAMRYKCGNGTCGTCIAKCLKGKIKQIKHHDFALSAEQKSQRQFLTCCYAPASDVELELDLIGNVKSIPIQYIETKVKKIVFINQHFAIITLRTPRSQTLQFMAGQDIVLSFKGITARYPLASCPCHGMELEFHVRNTPKNVFAQAVFNKKIKPKTTVGLKGPKGVFVLKEDSKRPIIFIAWDSGFAPIRSLIEHAFSLEMPNPIYFYWAYPANEKLPYLDNHAKSWHAVIDEYTYTRIDCEFECQNKNNYLEIAKKIFNTLDLTLVNESDVYIVTPAEMLIYLSELLCDNGLNESQLIASPI